MRQAYGKEATPTAGIIDSSSVATTESGGTQRGYDAGKKINGRKRHIVVDTLGLILSVVVHAANIQDQEGAKLVLHGIKDMYETLKVIFGDSAYKRCGLPDWVKEELDCVSFFDELLRHFGGGEVEQRGNVQQPAGWNNTLQGCKLFRGAMSESCNLITAFLEPGMSSIHFPSSNRNGCDCLYTRLRNVSKVSSVLTVTFCAGFGLTVMLSMF